MAVALLLAAGAAFFAAGATAAEPAPPEGFEALFNGRDLAGWYGLNPHQVADLTGPDRDAKLAEMRAAFPKHWRVEDGELVNDGTGPYATTEREFGDYELLVDYKTVPGADSGVYLRGMPQVQIWDSTQPFDPARPTRRPNLGSGGLVNNPPDTPGRYPAVLADRPFHEWNTLRIRQVGAVTSVWLNDKLVVDAAPMANFFEPTRPFPERGPIMLQTHGGEIRWRNILIRMLPPTETAAAMEEPRDSAPFGERR